MPQEFQPLQTLLSFNKVIQQYMEERATNCASCPSKVLQALDRARCLGTGPIKASTQSS